MSQSATGRGLQFKLVVPLAVLGLVVAACAPPPTEVAAQPTSRDPQSATAMITSCPEAVTTSLRALAKTRGRRRKEGLARK